MASTAHTVTMRGAQIGLKLRDDHPQAKGKHALYLDEGAFVLLDKMSKVSPSKKTGLIHHAEIRMISSHYGKRFPLIVGTEKPSGRAVVFASASTPKGVKSKVRFAQAVFAHASQIVLEDKSSALLELFDGESFDTLFETGRVDRYEAKSGQLKPVALDRADMALARIAYARSFEKCGVASVQDAVLHELLHVYRMEALSRSATFGWSSNTSCHAATAPIAQPRSRR